MHWYLADGTDLTTVPTLEEHDALVKPAGLIVSAALADGMALKARSPSTVTTLSDVKDWAMSDLVEVDEENQVVVKRRFCDLPLYATLRGVRYRKVRPSRLA